MKSYLFFVSLIFFITGNIEAKTIYIPGDYTTIQTGIDSAVSGDMVIVSKGTYSGGINMKGGIHLKSEEGPESTIISGGGSAIRCTGLTDTVLIDGFTIHNGIKDNYYGGGIYSYNSNIIIRNNIIAGNILEPLYFMEPAAGGGIFVRGGSALIENNIIRGNRTIADDMKNKKKSAGMLAKGRENNLQGNISKYYDAYGGSGIYAESTIVTIKNNVIRGNSAEMASAVGGGISCVNCIKSVIFNNLIYGNYAYNTKWMYGYGMGISCTGPVEITNNTIVNNYFPRYNDGNGQGGGIYCGRLPPGQDSIIIKNNIIAFDSSSIIGGGGGIYCDSLAKVFIGYNGFYSNIPDNFHNAPQGVGNFSWGVNRNGTPCDSFYNINIDPGFTNGTFGNYYQQNVSGCGDYIVDDEFGFLGGNTSDGKPDSGWVDLGYHYGVLIGVEEKEVSPPEADQNLELTIAPNPFTTMTGIKWLKGGEGQKNKIRIYDISGKLVKSFPLATAHSLLTTVFWDGRNEAGNKVTAGIYFVRLETSSSVISKKVTFLRK
ncbi:MAG: right-handed parallel beta-helix repeat-containing protein [bacterium]|nr:right-handed parallel beta-helix repeat-containing protein [bacterium]